LILARILARRRLGVSTSRQAPDHYGSVLQNRVAIYVSETGREILDRILDTPELEALLRATTWNALGEPDTDACAIWGEEIKRRVKALHWQRQALFYEKWAGETTPGGAMQKGLTNKSQDCRQKAGKLLGKLKPLSVDNIRSLVREVVNRTLPAQPQASQP
ncbi:hypothetical protein HYZ70_01720, partial [Candidatus Curtissbacteria bacterium]|nr:hypothetical protein [Candidatus Curtissbacteria bacterium]